jgi:hypothetical protein
VDLPLAELQDSPIAELVEDVAPYLVFVLIIAQEAWAFYRGKKSLSTAVGSGAQRGAKSLVARGAGAAASVLSPSLAAPASLMTRIGLERLQDVRNAAAVVAYWNSRLRTELKAVSPEVSPTCQTLS